jgi:UDPglucose 6-dehydrogenase
MITKYKIGIMGVGMVGGALKKYFESENVRPLVYDKFKNAGSLEEVNGADIIFIAVPTPYDEKTCGFDLSYVRQAIAEIKGEKIVVIKSTVLPGTTELLQKEFPQHKMMFNPEFLTEATALRDMFCPNRQIVGVTDKSADAGQEVLNLLPRAPFERIVPSKEAEMVKYFGNTLYALRVAFANQMYDLCGKMGIDYETVKECAKPEPMVGKSHLEIFHKGYRGYGGKCLPKDTRALIQLGNKAGMEMSLLKAAEVYNNALVAMQGIADHEKIGVIQLDLDKDR